MIQIVGYTAYTKTNPPLSGFYFYLAQECWLSKGTNMKNFGSMLDRVFSLLHFQPDGTTKEFELTVCKQPDPNGTRYATYQNGVNVVLTSKCFEQLKSMQGHQSVYPATHMPYKLRESLNLI